MKTFIRILFFVLSISIIFLSFSSSFSYEIIHNSSESEETLKQLFENTNYFSEDYLQYMNRWAQHPFLTRSAIKLFEDKYGNLFTDEEEKLIIRGSIEEDIDISPSLAMDKKDLPTFFDEPYYYLNRTSFNENVKKLIFTDHERCVNHFDPAILNGRRTTEFAQFQENGIYNMNYFAWENINKTQTNLKFIMLGHALHLIEDLGCPPHVRKDPHGGDWVTHESVYENLCGYYFFGINYTTSDSARIKANREIEIKSSLTEYFESLRDITQKGYFSKDTMFSEEFEQDFIEVNDDNHLYVYKNEIGGTKLAFKGAEYWKEYKKWYKKYKNDHPEWDDETIKEESHLKAKKFSKINLAVARDYFNELELQIIKHAAGVIKLFYDNFMASNPLEGTWYLRCIGTQKNGLSDHFGYDIGTFTFQSNGAYSGTMTDYLGNSWDESGNASVSSDGKVSLWLGCDAVMGAGKDIIIADYQDDDEFILDVFVKKASSYSTSDLQGTWYLRCLGTQKNGLSDHFGYDIGTFTFQSNGAYSGTMTDYLGNSWDESGSASVSSDGTVTLWLGCDAVMGASKDVIIADYQDDDEFILDLFVKKASSYSTSDLQGTWYLRCIGTQKNGLSDHFGYDTGTFTFQSNGSYTGTMTDYLGNSWDESGSASVSSDGTVSLWFGCDAVMGASKDVIIADYQDDDEFILDVFVKKPE